MSLKYQRVKQEDLNLPRPLRWLTRAFSSITLAVILLIAVVLYGVIGSIPIALLAKAGVYALLLIGSFIPSIAFIYLVFWLRKRSGVFSNGIGVWFFSLLLLLGSGVWCHFNWQNVSEWASTHPWFKQHHATIIYRLPRFEMTELEFYSWWPLKLILGLFVVNLIWATIRRIEFKFVNIGVLTVHTGIVTMGVGSILYGQNKIEGDALLWREDLGGRSVGHFYDQTTPAIFFTVAGRQLMLGLEDLPRYNDYDPQDGRFRIALHESEEFRKFFGAFGVELKATIPGFVSYGTMTPFWVDASKAIQHRSTGTRISGDDPGEDPGGVWGGDPGKIVGGNPGLRLGFGSHPGTPIEGLEKVVVARSPSLRVLEENEWGLEYLTSVSPDRIDDLMSRFEGPHGLVVEVPGIGFKKVYSIKEGDTIPLDGTGYTLSVESIGPYAMRFATRGYEQARDTRAMVAVRHEGELLFRRVVMHRYPERSQDFVPSPDDPSVGPMGRRTDPDPTMRLAYIDATKSQYRLLSDPSDPTRLGLLERVPDHDPVLKMLPGDRFAISDGNDRQMWVFLKERLTHATREMRPVSVPKNRRDPKEEGTYIHSIVPLDVEVVAPDSQARSTPTPQPPQRVWLTHMRYPEIPDQDHHPAVLKLAGIPQPVQIAFSRVRRPLPFSITLKEFEMIPVPGTDIPRDFVAELAIVDKATPGNETGGGASDISSAAMLGRARLNNPLVHHGIKISQTGWDPGDRQDPNHLLRDENGRLINQQRYSIVGVGNNVGIRIIFVGACLVVVGIPWAFYIKPLLLRRKKRKIQAQIVGQSRIKVPHAA